MGRGPQRTAGHSRGQRRIAKRALIRRRFLVRTQAGPPPFQVSFSSPISHCISKRPTIPVGLKAARFWCRIVPMAMAVQTDLLERAPFLAELGQRLEESREAGRLVLLGGEAGVGKTALLHRFCLLHRDSAQAFWGACDPLFTPRPLGPFLDIAEKTGGPLKEVLKQAAKPHEVVAVLLPLLRSR